MYIKVQKIQDFIKFIDLISGTNAKLKRDRARNLPPLTTKTTQTRARIMLGYLIESTLC
jgi:hypothetical protein